MTVVALDAMGGDQAPQAMVQGALRAYRVALADVPSLRNALLDRLVELADAGRLGEYIDRHAPDCE